MWASASLVGRTRTEGGAAVGPFSPHARRTLPQKKSHSQAYTNPETLLQGQGRGGTFVRFSSPLSTSGIVQLGIVEEPLSGAQWGRGTSEPVMTEVAEFQLLLADS